MAPLEDFARGLTACFTELAARSSSWPHHKRGRHDQEQQGQDPQRSHCRPSTMPSVHLRSTPTSHPGAFDQRLALSFAAA
jgi:hypothetical protein